jgi:hypothetical protein
MPSSLEHDRQLLFADFGADDLPGNHDLNPTVLLPSFGRGVVRDRHRLAETSRGQCVLREALIHQVAKYGLGSLL